MHERAELYGKKFCPKNQVNELKMGQRQSFLNLLANSFYCICSMVKTYIICCIPGQISYLGKFLILRYGSKCSQLIRLQDFLTNHIFRKKSTTEPYFLHVDTNSHKLKVGQKLFKRDSQKWAWPVWSWDSKIDCISRMTRSNELIFCMLVQFQEN